MGRFERIFEELGDGKMSKITIVKEFWDFLRIRKRYWLAPIVIILVLLGMLMAFAQSSAVAPFIYTLF